jgi:hypothetical protein
MIEGYQYQYSTYLLYTIDFKVTASGASMTKSVAASADILYGPSGTTQNTDVTVNVEPNTILISGEISQGKTATLQFSIAPKATSGSGTVFTTTPQFYDPPSGMFVSFNPQSVDVIVGRTSQVTVTVTMTPEFLQKAGTHRFAIGISGLLSGIFAGTSYQDLFITKTTILTVVVPAYFSVAARPAILDVYIGGEDQKLQIIVTPVSTGLNQPITLTVQGIPSGIVSSFERDTLIPLGRQQLSTNLILNAPSTTKPGVFPIRISASALGTQVFADASLNVRPSGDYVIKPDQNIVMLNARGESRSITLTITPQGDFRSTIDFSVSNLPRGVTATLSATSTTIQSNTVGTITLTLTASTDAQPGTYDVAIVANTGFSTKSISLTLLVRSGTEIWPVVLIVVVLITVISVIVFAGMPRRGRRYRVVTGPRRMPSRACTF